MSSLTSFGNAGTAGLLTHRPGLRRRVVDNAARWIMLVCFVAAVVPLILVVYYVIRRGLTVLSWGFLTHTMAFVSPSAAGGGIYAALIGTLEQVGLAALISVPIGLLVAIYIVEYGRGTLRILIRFFVDVMTGIPSIVAGLFIYVFWVVGLQRGFSGFAGAMALAILMLPIIIRSSEEMLLLVPNSLREASFALGISRWRTTMKVVLPTASAGITTGVMLAVARVVGETAPLIFTVFNNPYVNKNPFSGNQGALSLFIYDQAKSAYPAAIHRAWAGALSLIFIVMALYIGAQVLARRNTLTR
jgi:phosphate transport system permease protein